MRLEGLSEMARVHAALINVGVGDHHDQPSHIVVSNNSLSVSPLPGGPGVWDIAVPYNARAVKFSFRGPHVVVTSDVRAGCHGVASRNQLETSTVSMGGWTTMSATNKVAFYSKKAATMNLSHKVFTVAGQHISLTDAWLYETVPGVTRVFRTQWTNYGYSYYTLDVLGNVAVVG